MMISDKGEGDKFVPQRPERSRDEEASTGDKRDRSVSDEDTTASKSDPSIAPNIEPEPPERDAPPITAAAITFNSIPIPNVG